MKMNKTVLAVIVASSFVAGAANATSVPVQNFLDYAYTHGTSDQSVQVEWDNLSYDQQVEAVSHKSFLAKDLGMKAPVTPVSQAETDSINNAIVAAHDKNAAQFAADLVNKKTMAARDQNAAQFAADLVNKKTMAARDQNAAQFAADLINKKTMAARDQNAAQFAADLVNKKTMAARDQNAAQFAADLINKKTMAARDQNAAQFAADLINKKTVAAHQSETARIATEIQGRADRLASMKVDPAAVAQAETDRINNATVAAHQSETARIATEIKGRADRLASMKVDPAAVVVAERDQAAFEVAQGQARKLDNLERTSSQHPAVTNVVSGKDGVNGKDGLNGKDGKNGVTTVVADTVAINGLKLRAAQTDRAIEESRLAQRATNQAVADHTAELANHESRIQDLESSTNSKFASLKNTVDENRKRASAGIAGVAAMANIPQVTQGANFSVGAGAGNTDGESALAVGFSARASENVVVKASVSNDTQHNFVVGAGASYQW